MNTSLKGRIFESEIAAELKAVGYDIVFRPPPTTRWQRHVDFGPGTCPDAGIDLVGYKPRTGWWRLVQCKGYYLYPKAIARLKAAMGYWKGIQGEVWLVWKQPGQWHGRGKKRKFDESKVNWVRCV